MEVPSINIHSTITQTQFGFNPRNLKGPAEQVDGDLDREILHNPMDDALNVQIAVSAAAEGPAFCHLLFAG